MAMGKDDELDLIKQVVGLEVMQGQNTLLLKEIKDDLKALSLEYRNYRQNMDTRLGALERFQERTEKSKIDERLDRIENIERKLKGGWMVIILILGGIWTIFGDSIKRILP